MPPGRPATRRLVANENDENSTSTRMTRAKAAALDVDVLAPAKQPLGTKKSAVNMNTAAGGQKKRAALGDVTNAGKSEAVEGKKVVAKPGLVSKAAQPHGVQKAQARPTSMRPALANKDNKKNDVKRTGPGSIAAGSQKRKTASAARVKAEETIVEAVEPSRKRARPVLGETQLRSESKTVKVEDKPKKKVSLVEPEPEPEPEPESEEEEEAEPVAEAKPEPASENVYPPDVNDLDTEDIDDPLMAAEYVKEIFEYLRDLEVNSVPNPRYMDHQDDLEWKTRGILIDWLIEVHTRFHLLPETLFLAVNIIDRFLSEKVVQLDRLQLVGITAMFIASKYEEVLSPHVANFVHVADDGFSEAEILSAERFILHTLNFDLSYPNPMNFLRRISKADNYDIQSRTIGKYLMEISLLDHRFMAYRPSHVAAAAIYLARLILDSGDWDATITWYAGYSEEEIQPVFELMIDYLARPIIHEAFYKKYASKKFLKASILTRQWARKNAALFGIVDTQQSLDEISS